MNLLDCKFVTSSHNNFTYVLIYSLRLMRMICELYWFQESSTYPLLNWFLIISSVIGCILGFCVAYLRRKACSFVITICLVSCRRRNSMWPSDDSILWFKYPPTTIPADYHVLIPTPSPLLVHNDDKWLLS